MLQIWSPLLRLKLAEEITPCGVCACSAGVPWVDSNQSEEDKAFQPTSPHRERATTLLPLRNGSAIRTAAGPCFHPLEFRSSCQVELYNTNERSGGALAKGYTNPAADPC